MGVAAAVNEKEEGNNVRVGTVKSLVPLKIDVGGGSLDASGVLGSYVPELEDVVACLRQDSTWLVLGVVAPATENRYGRKMIARAALAGGTGLFTALTAVALTGVVRHRPNTAFEARWMGGVQNNAANAYADFRCKVGPTTGGLTLQEFFRVFTGPTTFTAVGFCFSGEYRTGPDTLDRQIVVTGQGSGNIEVVGGFGATCTRLEIWEIGPAAKFPDATLLT